MGCVCSAGYEPVLELGGRKFACGQSTRNSTFVPNWVGNGCGLSHIKVRAFHPYLSHYVCNTNGSLCLRLVCLR